MFIWSVSGFSTAAKSNPSPAGTKTRNNTHVAFGPTSLPIASTIHSTIAANAKKTNIMTSGSITLLYLLALKSRGQRQLFILKGYFLPESSRSKYLILFCISFSISFSVSLAANSARETDISFVLLCFLS